MEGEFLFIRTNGGPFPGSRVADPFDESTPEEYKTWPLPDELDASLHGGKYVKISESKLPPQPRDGHVVRGAEYEWRPDEGQTSGQNQ